MFPDIEYLDWLSDRPETTVHDLGSSDLRRTMPKPDGVVPPELADLPAPPEDLDLETIIAEEYDVETENVLVTAGATHANFIAVAATINGVAGGTKTDDENDENEPRVLVEKPGYEPLVQTPKGLGAVVDRFRRPAENDYALDPDRIESATTDDTECIVITNRHNPSGSRATRNTIADASRVAADHDAHLLVDEVYAPFCDSNEPSVFGGPTAVDLPNTIITNSLTKFHGFGSVRVGWLVADAEFVSRAKSVMYHVPAISGPAMALARRALYNDDHLAKQSRERIIENRELLAEFVSGRDDLTGTASPGCTYGFFQHESADGNEVSEAAWEEGVLVVPGRFFDDRSRFRLSLGLDSETVREGLDVFGSVLDEL
ncbi:pyridoxal phosphate-dependent aminotransferase [Haladaptatus caseinilyticus]|uniref:pyridoxal phosphate-dependent aminotransferase n=1 Tax=Haladaptatus caseinilyticus TaxID=2993314 RepID=UPI00224B1853|nr:pyridoxal phosphate-dependent aminotransferase [Haladaptatus caseinilyticus]